MIWGLSCCGLTSLVALWHVESSWTRDWTWVPCTGKWILNHWTREVPKFLWWGFLCCCWLVTPVHPSGLSSIIFLTTGGLYSLPTKEVYIPCKEDTILFRFFSHRDHYIQSIEQNFLCCTVGPYYLVYICVHVCVLRCSVMSNSLWPRGLQHPRLLWPWNSLGKNTGVGCHFLLQWTFLIQGSNSRLLCLLHCRQIIYPLSHWGRPSAGPY